MPSSAADVYALPLTVPCAVCGQPVFQLEYARQQAKPLCDTHYAVFSCRQLDSLGVPRQAVG